MDDLSNFRALQRFLDHWDRQEGAFEVAKATGQPRFRAAVSYDTQNESIAVTTTVTASLVPGFDNGRISISEAPALTREKFQLDFNPHIDSFAYNAGTHAFVIAGRSTKGGNYCVTVTPIGGK
jgi:hypothetical protein